jgi:hypothetical protein
MWMGNWCELFQSHVQALEVYDTLKISAFFMSLFKD